MNSIHPLSFSFIYSFIHWPSGMDQELVVLDKEKENCDSSSRGLTSGKETGLSQPW